MAAPLTKKEMYLILDQATIVLGEFYVHLPQKRARYAFDPLQALRLLEARVESLDKPREFHEEMFSIFNKLRDIHTCYQVRARDRPMATLPFNVGRSDDEEEPRYWVTEVEKGIVRPKYLKDGFGVGAELILWNGVPIERAIEILAVNFHGAHRDASLAQGLKYLCKRPTHFARPPAEEFVLVAYRPASGGNTKKGDKPVQRQARFHWELDLEDPEEAGKDDGDAGAVVPADGDVTRSRGGATADFFRRRLMLKGSANQPQLHYKDLICAYGQFAIDKAVVQRRRLPRKDAESRLPYEDDRLDPRDTSPFPPLDRALDQTLMLAKLEELRIKNASKSDRRRRPRNIRLLTKRADNFDASVVKDGGQDYGYIRLHTFEAPNPDKLVNEFACTLGELADTAGLILDIRDNPGGSVAATEGILQTLSKRKLPPLRWEYINSRGILTLVEDSLLRKNKQSSREATETGAVYLWFPEGKFSTSLDRLDQRARKGLIRWRKKKRDIVLVVSALCYSASDIFAAGFEDHKLGKIIGVHGRTGAGGANVMGHEALKTFFPDHRIELKHVVDNDHERKRLLLKEGESRIKEVLTKALVTGPADGRKNSDQPSDRIDWFVNRQDGITEYWVSFLPWITKSELLVYAKTPEAVERSTSRIKELPDGISISFALRRTVRQGKNNQGHPLEDVGVETNPPYRLTKRDVLGRGSQDLIAKALNVLRGS